jgi:hypothetical protein
MDYGDWEDAIRDLDDPQLADVIKAIATLRDWPVFYQEFKGLGTFGLQVPLLYEAERRRRAEMPLGSPKRYFDSQFMEFRDVTS